MNEKNQNQPTGKIFENSQEEISFYRTKCKKYKEKFLSFVESHKKLRDEFSQLLLEYENLKDQFKSEKALRKKYENKVIEFMKFDQRREIKKFSNLDKEENLTLENFEKIEKNLMKTENFQNLEKSNHQMKFEFFNNKANENSYRVNIDKVDRVKSTGQDDLVCRDSMNVIDFFRNSSIKKEPNYGKEKISELIETSQNTERKQSLNSKNSNSGSSSFKMSSSIPDSNLNSTILKEKNLKEITEKFDTEKMKKSLTIDFIEYEKDSLGIRRKIISREDKINRLEKILNIWVELTEYLKKSLDNFTYTLSYFNENFIKEPLDIFEECPDLISLIYILQSVVGDISSQHKIFSITLENSFISQIKNFVSQSIPELRENKMSLIKHTDDFSSLSSKFLATKKSNIKDSMKDTYFAQLKMLEFTRYDFVNRINKCLLFTRVDLPEKISLLIWGFLCLFKQGNEILNKIEQNVSANLEKISVKHKEKEKILDEIKLNKKELLKQFENVNTSLIVKEGFLNVKPKDTSEYFKRRYF